MVIIYLYQDIIIHQRSHLGMFLSNRVVIHICRYLGGRLLRKLKSFFTAARRPLVHSVPSPNGTDRLLPRMQTEKVVRRAISEML